MILAVAYDLHNPGRDYPKIELALKRADGGWAHPQGSFWILETREDCATWRYRLAKLGDANDEMGGSALHRGTQAQELLCMRRAADNTGPRVPSQGSRGRPQP